MKRFLAIVLAMLLCGGSALARDNSQYSLATITQVPDFSTVDQWNAPLDQRIFANAQYTLLVFWGTWCGPCVAEIPVLVGAQEALLDMGVQIVGICEDGQSNREHALEILKASQAEYINIMPNDQFYDEFVSLCFTFPSALLVGGNGQVLENQFFLNGDSQAVVEQIETMLAAPDVSEAQAESAAAQAGDPIEAFYENYKKEALSYGISESSLRISNIPAFVEMHKKAYAYTTDHYYLQIDTEVDGTKKGEIRRFVTDGSYRQEEYQNGRIAYVTVYNATSDEYVQYDVAAGAASRVSNASLKGYRSTTILYGSMDVIGNNALLGELSDDSYQGRPAVLSSFAWSDNSMVNKVWFDKENGVPMRFMQEDANGSYTETYTFAPGRAFDSSVFTFDADELSADPAGM